MKALMVIGLSLALGATDVALTACDEAAQVAHDELGPKALLKKYMMFKDMHAQLDRKQADIKVYQNSMKSISDMYAGVPRVQWAREDRDTFNQKSTEVAGVISSYNDLAADYNAKMSEINYRFCNVGTLPQGATEPLPREYAPYRTE
jgi:hypothetical protein